MSAYTPEERAAIREQASALNSDGCSGPAVEVYQDCCLAHDIAYRTGFSHDGRLITREQADAEFRRCIQAESKLGALSPMSWWRWASVRLFGSRSWKGIV